MAFEGGEAGADDTCVGFDVGPEDRVHGTVGGVGFSGGEG